MTDIKEFNQIDDCDKIPAECINAYLDYKIDPENPTTLCAESSWGGDCLDLTSIVKAAETVTTLHLSPEENPNCLEFEREDGQSDCIHGDDLSRIISMRYLKDVDQNTPPTNGDVYMYRDGKFYTFNLQQFVNDTNTTIQNMQATINQILAKLTPPADAPDNVGLAWSNINLYSDPNVQISEGSGTPTSLDKTHGIYSHLLSESRYADEIFG